MQNLYLLYMYINDGYNITNINITVLFCILTGILVIITKNPIVSVLFLIGLFISISVNLSFLGLNFIALSYLLVYVGAVSILFLFILMLINVRISEIISSTNNSILLAFALGLIFFSTMYHSLPVPNNFSIFNINNKLARRYNDNLNEINNDKLSLTGEFEANNNSFYSLLLNSQGGNNGIVLSNNNIDLFEQLELKVSNSITLENLFKVTSNFWDNSISHLTDINSIGNILYTHFPIYLILTGMVLLLCMVGCIIITIKTNN